MIKAFFFLYIYSQIQKCLFPLLQDIFTVFFLESWDLESETFSYFCIWLVLFPCFRHNMKSSTFSGFSLFLLDDANKKGDAESLSFWLLSDEAQTCFSMIKCSCCWYLYSSFKFWIRFIYWFLVFWEFYTGTIRKSLNFFLFWLFLTSKLWFWFQVSVNVSFHSASMLKASRNQPCKPRIVEVTCYGRLLICI